MWPDRGYRRDVLYSFSGIPSFMSRSGKKRLNDFHLEGSGLRSLIDNTSPGDIYDAFYTR